MAWKVYNSAGLLKVTDPVVPAAGITGTLPVNHGGTGNTTATGTGQVVLDTSPTVATPTLTSPVLNTGVSGTAVDTDGTLAANSDTKLASQKAVKTYTAAQLALAALLASSNTFTNVNDFDNATVRVPSVSSADPTATEGYIAWDDVVKYMKIYDGTRGRGLSPVGFVPYAGAPGADNSMPFATTVSLAAAGGTFLLPIYISAHMYIESASFWNTDVATARTWRWDLYIDRDNSGSVLNRVALCSGDTSFTPGAAARRSIAASVVEYLAPGLYWLAIQNRHAANTLGFGVNAGGGGGLWTSAKTKTTTNPFLLT